MADKAKIGAGLAVDGEKEFKAAISGINKDLAVLSSEMGKVTSQYEENADSLESLSAKQDIYNRRADEQKKKVETLTAALNSAKTEYGENSDKVKDWQIKLNNAEAELSQTEKALKSTTSQLDKYGKEVKQATDSTEKATKESGMLQKIFAGGLLANVASNALSSVVSMVKELASAALDTADELEKMSSVTGRSVEELQALQYVGDDLGVSLDTITSAQKKLTKSMDGAKDGTEANVEAFEKLGVEYKNADGSLRNVNTVMGEAFDALGKVGNETERDALAMELFGKSATDLNPLIKAGSQALADLSNEAKNTNAIMSEDAVKALDAAGDAMDHAKQRAVAYIGEALGGIIGSGKTAAETMTDLEKSLDMSQSILDLIKNYEDLTQELKSTTLSAKEVTSKTEELEQVKQDLISASNGVVTAVGLENGTFDQQVGKLKELTESQKSYNKYQLQSIALENTGTKAMKNAKKAQEEYDQAYKTLTETLDAVAAAQEHVENGDPSQWGVSWATKLETLNNLLPMLRQNLSDAAASMGETELNAKAANTAITTLVSEGYMTASEACTTFGLTSAELNTLLTTSATASNTLTESEVLQAQTATDLQGKITSLGAELSALSEKYNAAYQASYDSLTGTMGLWGQMDTQAATSVADVQAALESQVDWLTEYNDNLTALANREIPEVDTEALVKSLSDGSTESAEILAGLATATDEEITDIVESLGDVETGKEKLSQTMAEVETDFSDAMDAISLKVDDAVDEMNNAAEAGTAARDTMNGYISQTKSMIPTLKNTYRQAALAANQAYRDALEMHSPSKKAIKNTQDYFNGAILEAEKMQGKMEKAFAETASLADKAAYEAMPQNRYGPDNAAGNAITGMSTANLYLDSAIVASVTSRVQYRTNQTRARSYGVVPV